MNYVDGFVAAVPAANKGKYIEHAKHAGALFKELGVIRMVECWGDDVPNGEVTDFTGPLRRKTVRSFSSLGSSGRTRQPAMRACKR